MKSDPQTQTKILEMTVGIVSTFLAANKTEKDSVSGLILSVHASLASLAAPGTAVDDVDVVRLGPAQVRRLITPAGIISLINQKPFKSMKRHVTSNGYTPESYRQHFGLPADFPMVHPDYARARSDLAKAMGLGQGGRKPKKTKGEARGRASVKRSGRV